MRLLWPVLRQWLSTGTPFALATVTSAAGSAPRRAGAVLAVAAGDGGFCGSTSNGCLEAEVIDAASACLGDLQVRDLHFDAVGDPPWREGLACGGSIDIRAEPWWALQSDASGPAAAEAVRRWLDDDSPGALLSRGTRHLAIDATGNPDPGPAGFSPGTVATGRRLFESGHGFTSLQDAGGPVLFRPFPRQPRLCLVGAVEIAVHLSTLATASGWKVAVIDPRAAYASPHRFPSRPWRLAAAEPADVLPTLDLGPADAAAVLSHDPRIDDPALTALLSTPVGWIGALGSTSSHAARRDRLSSAGHGPDDLARIEGPAGIRLRTGDAVGAAAGILAGILRWSASRVTSGDSPPPP